MTIPSSSGKPSVIGTVMSAASLERTDPASTIRLIRSSDIRIVTQQPAPQHHRAAPAPLLFDEESGGWLPGTDPAAENELFSGLFDDLAEPWMASPVAEAPPSAARNLGGD